MPGPMPIGFVSQTSATAICVIPQKALVDVTPSNSVYRIDPGAAVCKDRSLPLRQ